MLYQNEESTITQASNQIKELAAKNEFPTTDLSDVLESTNYDCPTCGQGSSDKEYAVNNEVSAVF